MNTRLLLVAFLILSYLIAGCAQQGNNINIEKGHKTINGTEIYYKKMGTGEPMIVVHGGPMLDHSYLLPHLESMAEQYELIFFDQRLSGRSSADVDSTEVTMKNFVDDIEALRSSFGLDRVHLLGHSWGGQLSMRYAVSYSQNLRSLILLNPMPASAELWNKEETELATRMTKHDRKARREIMDSEGFKKNSPEAIESLLRLSFKRQFHDTTLVDSLDLYIPQDYGKRSQLFANLMPELREYDLHPELSEMTIPTLIVYGASEPAADLSGPRLDRTIPNSELVIIEKSGHFPFIERPNQLFSEIQLFLN